MKRQTQGWSMTNRLMHYVIRIPESTCWYWDGKLDKDGYGQTWDGKRGIRAHRASYEEFVGPIPDGHHIHHKCKEPTCINPRHLETLTPSEHARIEGAIKTDRVRVCRKCGGEKVSNGHGSRICRPCSREYNRAYHQSHQVEIRERKLRKRRGGA